MLPFQITFIVCVCHMMNVTHSTVTKMQNAVEEGIGAKKTKDTYNTRDSLVVSDPTTSLALSGLSMGERTGSRIFQWVWLYV